MSSAQAVGPQALPDLQAQVEQIIAEARRQGVEALWLGVWERNPRAIAFYRRWGFEKIGEHEFLLGADLQTDHVMAQRLPADEGKKA